MTEQKRTTNLAWARSIEGIVSRGLANQKRRSKGKAFGAPQYTKSKLYLWCLNDVEFKTLHEEYVASGYVADLRPTFDRIDNLKGYSFDNIQALTMRANVLKG